tara:strand:- start:11785 stop:12978 length:1194 start_codon:yes stop_codon:yes gene_type:complete
VNDYSSHRFFADNEPTSQKILFGNGSRKKVVEFAKELGSRILLVTDCGLTSVGHPQEIMLLLEGAGLKVTLYDKSVENPTEKSVESCAQVAKEANIDLIIGLGGGSSMDTAKGCNFILTNGGRMSDYWGVGKATSEMLPFIAIPTTAGTGSECQSFALISQDETNKKMACGDTKALPAVTILDPYLTLSQPFSVTACTGIDALAHALESSVTTKRNEFSHRHAKIAFDLINSSLPLVLQKPDDLESRGKVLLGASHAGAAIEQSMLGAAHSVANPLTAAKKVVHGIAVGLALPKVMQINSTLPEVKNIYSEFSRDCGLASPNSSNEEATEMLIKHVLKIISFADLPSSLDELGFSRSDIPDLSSNAAEQWTARFNPKTLLLEDFENIYESLFAHISC